MSKELNEAWTTIYHYNDEIIHDMGSEYVENPLKEEIDIVNNALLELKAIKEANPIEALKIFSKVDNVRLLFTNEERNTIKQALLKAQEQEKVLSIIKEKDVDVSLLKQALSVKQYNDFISFKIDYMDYMKLTEEEFDLLKRLLRNA